MLPVRLLLLSDIHANEVALDAVVRNARRQGFERVYSLGDALGYGPRPREVLEALRGLHATCILGNHEQMLLAPDGPPQPSGVVGQALEWQLEQLESHDLIDLESWQDGLDDDSLGARFRHGSPLSLDSYTNSLTAAREAFAHWDGRLGFVGHTHVPGVYATLQAPVGEWVKFQSLQHGDPAYPVPPAARVILNPGSVGQPRDGDFRASYGLYDSLHSSFQVHRVDYEVARTQAQIREAGLPEVLAARLGVGQ